MTLNFPFRNITINELWNFLEKSKIHEYQEIILNPDSWRKKHFEDSIQMWKEGLVSFENELLQVINTTNQETIDEYFRQTYGAIEHFHNYLNIDHLKSEIRKWNQESYKLFEENVEKKSQDFFNSKNPELKHLEEYEEEEKYNPFFFPFPLLQGQKKLIKKINHNYYCVEAEPDYIPVTISEDYFLIVKDLFIALIEVFKKYYNPWKSGNLHSKVEQIIKPKPILFLEGEHDITYIRKASELLNKTELLEKIELRQREGFRNLDKLWLELNKESWETIPQTKIFLYDCDTNKKDEDFGYHFKRIIPTRVDGMIKSGIENLFPNDLVNNAIKEKKAFVDFKKESGIIRGVEYQKEHCEVNKDEKKNFCDWVCQNANNDDFGELNIIFDLIEELIA